MNIIEQNVPEYVKYISDWKDYRLPDGHCIVDKDICGCGYTEYCIRSENPYNTILCSPRIVLLENKMKKHQGEPNVYYYRSDQLKEIFDKQYTGKIPGKKSTKSDIISYNKERFIFTSGILRQHYMNCKTMHIPCRILCTYDSFHTILEILQEVISDFHVVVDEFQSIFTDSFFKANIENEFFSVLQKVPNVTYLSATPMLDVYMDQVPGFKDLPFYKFNWSSLRTTKAFIKESWVSDPYKEVTKIIDIYKNRPLDRPWKDINGVPTFSEEAVFYVNSVAMIKKIIQKAKLTPDDINIICSDTPLNRKTIRSIRKDSLPDGVRFQIGDIPGENEPHKMFTICTRTVYLGADFYSTNAATYVVSDANVQSLVLDIRLDLPQILGRQRLEANPWKNECIVFYKTLADDKIITKEDFIANINNKRKETLEVLENSSVWNDATKKRMKEFYIDKYAELNGNILDYAGYTNDGEITYNQFLELAEIRAWELTQLDYKSNITVTKSIGDLKNVEISQYLSKEGLIAQGYINEIKGISGFDSKLRKYCEIRDMTKSDVEVTSKLLAYYRGTDLENLYSHFGTDRCKANRYRALDLKKILSDEISVDPIKSMIYTKFELTKKYTLKEIKNILSEIYTQLTINKSPKATDLAEYFVVKECKLYDNKTKKQSKGYQLISMK